MALDAMKLARGFALLTGLIVLAGLLLPGIFRGLPFPWYLLAIVTSVLAVVFRLIAAR